MKTFINKISFRNNLHITLIFLFGFLCNLANWIFLFLNIQPKNEPIPLHYNIYFGIDLIGPWYNLYVMAGSGLIIFLINIWLIKGLPEKEKLIKYILAMSTAFCQLILLVASIFIILQIV